MLAPDIVQLRQFYASPLGVRVEMALKKTLLRLWPTAERECVLGLGYAAPYMEPYLERAECVALAMPAQQGASYWPPGQPNRSFLAVESRLPLPDESFNRILLVHALEHSEQLRGMLEECWRILIPGGRMLAFVPNRHGIWARSPSTPFGTGRPFSLAQLRAICLQAGLTPLRHATTLHAPPLHHPLALKACNWVEALGFHLSFLGGVIVLEAEKQIYAAVKEHGVPTQRVRLSPHPAIVSAKNNERSA